MELIAEYDELQLFMMAFPVKFLIDVLLPMANQSMMNEMDLSEFFVWLGCIFFMACHPGVSDRRLWWSKKEISPREGAPF